MTDSVKAGPAGRSGGLRNIDRSTLAGVQSPRLLRRTVLERALRDAPQAPDEVLGALEIGARVRTVPGSHSGFAVVDRLRSEEHTSELQSRGHLVCRLLLEKKKK